ncbi:MAG: toxin-antitoxin system YwqK family antitoxin [Deferribacteraceae bacterium]|nr:toxin-antitoxin system YwqK family antitoxin [Deferribacteraceae bacterium]
MSMLTMKNLPIILLILLLAACAATSGSVDPRDARCDFDYDELVIGDKLFATKPDGTPVSGLVCQAHPQGRWISNYKNGNRHGLTSRYDSSGRLDMEANYKDGLMEGIARMYHPNGQLANEVNHKNGMQEGIEKRYDEDGTLRMEAVVKKDLFDGEFKLYDEAGKLQIIMIFEQDRPISGKCPSGKELSEEELMDFAESGSLDCE